MAHSVYDTNLWSKEASGRCDQFMLERFTGRPRPFCDISSRHYVRQVAT